MRRIDIINMFRTLGKIKLNKVEDKKLRNDLITGHLIMFRVVKEDDDYVASLRKRFDPEAVKDVNEAYRKYAEEEISIDIPKVDREAFADVIAKGDIDFTLGELTLLGPIFKETRRPGKSDGGKAK